MDRLNERPMKHDETARRGLHAWIAAFLARLVRLLG